jgi:hypothetical protein
MAKVFHVFAPAGWGLPRFAAVKAMREQHGLVQPSAQEASNHCAIAGADSFFVSQREPIVAQAARHGASTIYGFLGFSRVRSPPTLPAPGSTRTSPLGRS